MTDAGQAVPTQEPAGEHATCLLCGATADPPPLTWAVSQGPRGRTWSCEACTREHLRAMEARLDDEHW